MIDPLDRLDQIAVRACIGGGPGGVGTVIGGGGGTSAGGPGSSMGEGGGISGGAGAGSISGGASEGGSGISAIADKILEFIVVMTALLFEGSAEAASYVVDGPAR